MVTRGRHPGLQPLAAPDGRALHKGRTLMWATRGGVLETTDFVTFGKLEDADIGALIDAEHFPD